MTIGHSNQHQNAWRTFITCSLCYFLVVAVAQLGVLRCTAFSPTAVSRRPSSILQGAKHEYDAGSKTEKCVDHDPMQDSFFLSARTARVVSSLAILMSNTMAANALPSAGKFDEVRNRYFPGSLTASVILLRVASSLRKRGFLQYNTMLASSIDSDEINHTPYSLVSLIQSKFLNNDVGIYNIPGVGGVPISSATSSFSDFVAHSPKDGKLILAFGPSIGISQDGVLGQVERAGQDGKSPSSRLLSLVSNPKGDVNSIEKAFQDKTKSLGGSGNQGIASATDILYDMIWNALEPSIQQVIAKAETWQMVSEIVVIGGVTVNRGHGGGIPKGEDSFQPLLCRSYTPSGMKSIYDELFGDLSTPRSKL